ncbi:MAG: ubiquinone/menaquinone biosynthesis methyltransferase [Sedimentisphaerales bacterium]|nr:ubiquinone/menaquinone biosynthesis methyltransferase [Sedimentisphaerales bacterium]
MQNQPKNTNQEDVQQVFTGIEQRYDMANHILSFGLDYYWRRRTVKLAMMPSGWQPFDRRSKGWGGSNVQKEKSDGITPLQILDMCCGTGDLTLTLAKTAGPDRRITGIDFCPPMLDLARQKHTKILQRQKVKQSSQKQSSPIVWIQADCRRMPFPDASFDRISCAFGIRNIMDDLPVVLAEAHRLLKPGGRLCILEFSLPRLAPIRWIYTFYLRFLLPLLGGLITSRRSSYLYLAGSIYRWSKEIDLSSALASAGFTQIRACPLSARTVEIHVAEKERYKPLRIR